MKPSKTELFMPFRIMIAESIRFSRQNPRFYTKNGEPFYQVNVLPDIYPFTSQEFSDALFCEILSIYTVDQAKAFSERNPSLRFFISPSIAIQTIGNADYMTEKEYYETAIKALDLYRDCRDFFIGQQEYLSSHDDDSLERMVSFFRKRFTTVNTFNGWASYNAMIDDLYADNYHEEDIIDATELEVDEYNEKAWRAVKQYRDNYMHDCVSKFLLKITGTASTYLNPDDLTIEYRCNDLITAMYMFTFVSIQNKYTYKICAHPSCNRYYRVNPIHPQTRCPIHMAARQHKRQNQRIKEKELDALQSEQID